MDPYANPTTALNGIDLSVSSLAFFIVQLEMNCSTGGPINHLPPELMQIIMAKLGLDGDVKKLIRLRLVSTRWKAVVEDYCRLKKCLLVHMKKKNNSASNQTDIHTSHCIHFSDIKKRFFGYAILRDFACLFLSNEMALSQCLTSVRNLFPNTSQLSVRCDEQTQIPELLVYINSLNSLKQIHFDGPFLAALPDLSPVLFKLEHVSLVSEEWAMADAHRQLISLLGPNCARVYFGKFTMPLHFSQILQWQDINPQWLKNLTHLRISIHYDSMECDRIVHLLSKHATSLEHLSFDSLPESLVMTPTIIGHLGKLIHLVKLELIDIGLNMSELKQSRHGLIPLSSVLTCKIVASIELEDLINSDEFMLILSIIFPNLVELDLFIFCDDSTEGKVRNEMVRQLYRFPNLRKHYIYLY